MASALKAVTPVFQTMFVATHGMGNCMNAAIASLLDRDLSEVALINTTDPQWWHSWKAWLKGEGYHLEVRSKIDPPSGYALMCVLTDRVFPLSHTKAGERISHVCVCKDGVFIHDPYLGASEVRDLLYYYQIIPLSELDADLSGED